MEKISGVNCFGKMLWEFLAGLNMDETRI